MRAAVIRSFGEPLRLEELPIPEAAAGQVLVRLVASGVCHSDLHTADGEWAAKPALPLIPGHEGAGTVAACGPGVNSVKVGDRVGVSWLHSACGRCEWCLAGWESLCPAQQKTGYTVNGCYAEFVTASAAYVATLPDDLDFAQAAPILCAGVTTYKGLRETEAQPGDWVAIVGVGGLGHVAIQYATAMGLHVAAVDVADDKVALASDVGAQLVVNSRASDPVAAIRKQIGGVHGALVTAASRVAFDQSVRMLRRGGTCVLIGLPSGEFSAPILDVVLKRLTIRGSYIGTREDMQAALQFAAEGKVKVHIETALLEEINEAFARLRRGEVRGRIVLEI